jgi:outer membrane protein OmpA-like peptidoglycan-associated protein
MWAGQLRMAYRRIDAIDLSGHTDLLGNARLNKDLSERRVNAIRAELLPLLPGTTITARGLGAERPSGRTTQCAQAQNLSGRALKEQQACLAPDRRVEYLIKGELKTGMLDPAAMPPPPPAAAAIPATPASR